MTYILGSWQKLRELNCAKCPNPQAAATAFLELPFSQNLPEGSLATAELLKRRYLEERNPLLMAKALYHVANYLGSVATRGAIYQQMIPYFPKAHADIRDFWDDIREGAYVKCTNVNYSEKSLLQGTKRGFWLITPQKASGEEMIIGRDGYPVPGILHIREYPSLFDDPSPGLQAAAKESTNLLPPLVNIIRDYVEPPPSLYKEDLQDLEQRLQRTPLQ